MRLLGFVNNRLGYQVIQWLKDQSEQLVGLVVHPATKRQYGQEILNAAGLPQEQIFDGSQLRDPGVVRLIEQLNPDLGLSVLFGYILRQEIIDLFPQGIVNLHPSLLPFNRGSYPNVWSIVDQTPAGVTLHFIDSQIDTGSIIAQREVSVSFKDTGETLYRRLETEGLGLFKETWPSIRNNTIQPQPQAGQSSCYRVGDVQRIDPIELDKTYKAQDLINILRARTFSPYKGAYVQKDGKRIYLRLELLTEEEL